MTQIRLPESSKPFSPIGKGKPKNKLKTVFQTNQEVLILAATGTGAMDATVTNLFSKGDKVITVNGGKFGD